MSPTQWLTAEEAAEHVRRDLRYIYYLVEKRLVPYHRVGKYLYFCREDLDELISRGRVEPIRSYPLPSTASPPRTRKTGVARRAS